MMVIKYNLIFIRNNILIELLQSQLTDLNYKANILIKIRQNHASYLEWIFQMIEKI